MLCVEDYIDTLKWAESIGGLSSLIGRSEANLALLADWVGRTAWVDFLNVDVATRSSTSVCLKVVDPRVTALPADVQEAVAKKIVTLLDAEGIAYDIGAYRDAPAGLRIWAGSTIDVADLQALTPWLDWAFETAVAELVSA
jgi:phosphoserine aminotransferase